MGENSLLGEYGILVVLQCLHSDEIRGTLKVLGILPTTPRSEGENRELLTLMRFTNMLSIVFITLGAFLKTYEDLRTYDYS